MTIEVSQADIATDAAIEAELRDLGLHFLKLVVPAVDNEPHWHSFSSVFYVSEGTLQLTDVETVISPSARQILIGNGFLEELVLTVDRPGGRVCLGRPAPR